MMVKSIQRAGSFYKYKKIVYTVVQVFMYTLFIYEVYLAKCP
jgi:hypothetical protein